MDVFCNFKHRSSVVVKVFNGAFVAKIQENGSCWFVEFVVDQDFLLKGGVVVETKVVEGLSEGEDGCGWWWYFRQSCSGDEKGGYDQRRQQQHTVVQ